MKKIDCLIKINGIEFHNKYRIGTYATYEVFCYTHSNLYLKVEEEKSSYVVFVFEDMYQSGTYALINTKYCNKEVISWIDLDFDLMEMIKIDENNFRVESGTVPNFRHCIFTEVEDGNERGCYKGYKNVIDIINDKI